MACPVRNKDGSWKMVVKEFNEEIPDLGRHSLYCNKCGDPHYPECAKRCPDAKDYIEK
jgi:hypothetical protein